MSFLSTLIPIHYAKDIVMKVGTKIKTARKLRDISQTELGFLVGLHVDRVRAYEANMRNPKDTQLQVFADSLGIPIDYFRDHKIESTTDIMQILFELENMIGLSVTPTEYGTYALSTTDVSFNLYLERWYAKKMELKNGKCTKEEYDLWCARFPQSISEDLHERMMMQIENDKKTE